MGSAQNCHTDEVTNLRQRYRDYLGRLEGAGSPRDTIKQGLQVPSPMDKLRNDLALRAELRPSQTNYLLLGNIGTGKTLQLMLIEEHLKESQDIQALYLDANLEQEISLTESVAHMLIQKNPSLEQMVWTAPTGASFIRVGKTDMALSNPEALLEMVKFLKSRGISPVLLIDGLDRMTAAQFDMVATPKLQRLRDAGLGTIVIGPPRIQYDDPTGLKGRFERVFIQPVLDPNDPAQADFLSRVLRQRASPELLPEEAAMRCVLWSGGLMRDLLLLAQLAGEEAYVHGAAVIEDIHVTSAAHHLGERMAHALTPTMREKIYQIEESISKPDQGYTAVAATMWADLLSENFLLSYRDRQSMPYAFHPCLRLHVGLKAAAQ